MPQAPRPPLRFPHTRTWQPPAVHQARLHSSSFPSVPILLISLSPLLGISNLHFFLFSSPAFFPSSLCRLKNSSKKNPSPQEDIANSPFDPFRPPERNAKERRDCSRLTEIRDLDIQLSIPLNTLAHQTRTHLTVGLQPGVIFQSPTAIVIRRPASNPSFPAVFYARVVFLASHAR